MTTLLNWRAWAAIVLSVVLAASHWKAYVMGGRAAKAQLTEEHLDQARAMLRESELARGKEQELQTKVRKVANDYHAQKQARATDAVRTADSLRQYQAALDAARAAAADPAPPGGADAAIARIAGECAVALAALDDGARQYRATAQALQDYTRSVCLSPPQAPPLP